MRVLWNLLLLGGNTLKVTEVCMVTFYTHIRLRVWRILGSVEFSDCKLNHTCRYLPNYHYGVCVCTLYKLHTLLELLKTFQYLRGLCKKIHELYEISLSLLYYGEFNLEPLLKSISEWLKFLYPIDYLPLSCTWFQPVQCKSSRREAWWHWKPYSWGDWIQLSHCGLGELYSPPKILNHFRLV